MKMESLSAKLGLCALLLVAVLANAQSYPAKPIRIVIAFAPGGGSDAVSRLIGQKITESWGVQVITDNRPGAAGIIAGDLVAKAQPDGYTLGNLISSHVVLPSLYRKVPFDPITDFTPIIMLMRSPNVICVHPSLPVRSIKELVALARARPGSLVFGSAGIGGSNHLTGEMFRLAVGIDIQHLPYKGGGPAAADLVGGHIPMTVSSIGTVVPYIQAGRIRALAVTSTKRQVVLPDVPTLDESGYPGFDAAEWWVVLGPANMPKDIAQKLNTEIDRIMRLPDIQKWLTNLANEYMGSTPEQAGAYMRSEMNKWSKVVQSAGIKLD